MPAVGGVAKRAEICVMRRNDDGAATRGEQPVEFFHGAYHVGDVLDDMRYAQLAKRVIAERIREMVEVSQDVGVSAGIAIDTDGARVFIAAAADVQNRKPIE